MTKKASVTQADIARALKALLDVGCPKLKAWTYWAYVRARHIALGEG